MIVTVFGFGENFISESFGSWGRRTFFSDVQNIMHLVLVVLAFIAIFYATRKIVITIMAISVLIILYSGVLGFLFYGFNSRGLQGLMFEIIIVAWSIYNYKLSKRVIIS